MLGSNHKHTANTIIQNMDQKELKVFKCSEATTKGNAIHNVTLPNKWDN